MALNLQACIVKPCDGSVLKITDTTGLYNNSTSSPYYNLGGWGTPNMSIVTVTAATLTIYAPDPTTKLPSTTGVEIDVFNTLPNFILTPFEVTEEDYGNSWIDGIYYFVYSVTGDLSGTETTYTYTQYQLIDCEVACCVQNLAVKAPCNKMAQQLFTKAYDILTEMRFSARCGNTNQAAKLLTELQELCDGEECQCGGGCGGC